MSSQQNQEEKPPSVKFELKVTQDSNTVDSKDNQMVVLACRKKTETLPRKSGPTTIEILSPTVPSNKVNCLLIKSDKHSQDCDCAKLCYSIPEGGNSSEHKHC